MSGFGVKSLGQFSGLMKAIFTDKNNAVSLKRRLIENVAGTLGLKVAATILSFVSSMLLARWLGTTGYGTFAYAITWVGLLGVPAALGLPLVIVREIAAYQTRSEWSLIKGLLRWANQVVALLSVGLALLAVIIAWNFHPTANSQMLSTFWIVVLSLPFNSLIIIRQSAMQGLHRVVSGQLVDMLIRPILFIILIGGVYLFIGQSSANIAAVIHLISTAAAWIIGTQMLRHTLPREVKEAIPDYQTKAWMASSWPLMIASAMNFIYFRTDTIMLGAMKGAAAVGLYVVANRGSDLVALSLTVIQPALAPTLASLYAQGDIKQLQRLMAKSSQLLLISSLPIAILLIGFGQQFLLLFGHDFQQSYATLVILTTAQLVNVSMGPVSQLLIMTGGERDVAVNYGISAGINIILNAILIPNFGLEGAATATGISLIFSRVLLGSKSYQKLGLKS